MRNNYKRSKRSKGKRLKNQKSRPTEPKQGYMSDQYNYNEYGNRTYYNTSHGSEPRKTSTSRTAGTSPTSSIGRKTSTKRRTSTKQKNSGKKTPSNRTVSKRTTRIKAEKKKTRFFMGRIIFLIGLIIGVIYVISIVLDTTQKPVISYQTVQRGIIDNSGVFDGLIVRNEQVIPNTKEGNMYLIAAEGDRVKKDGQVYQILDASEVSILEKDMQNVESDIEKIQAKRQDISYFQNEIQEINKSINNNVEIYYMQAEPGKFEQTHELKKQLEYEIVKRKNIHMKDSTAALNELKDQKQDLSTQLRSNEWVYMSPDAGIISYYTDGFEEMFKVDNLDAITEKDIKQKYNNKSTTASQIIGTNEPAYRVVKDNKWNVVSFMPESWAERFKVGQKYEFALIEDSSVEFKLKVEENTLVDKQHKIVFSSDEQLDIFLSTRTISFKSLQYMYEGLKIPSSAVTERNLIKVPVDYIVSSQDGKGVMKSSGATGESMFVGLNIQYEDENGYAHVLQRFDQQVGLKLGDSISHPSKTTDQYVVSEVSTVEGVYAVNGRITKFKPINTIAQNDEYLIVKPNSTSGLKQFDQIVTNPKNIQDEELLRNMDVKNNKQQ